MPFIGGERMKMNIVKQVDVNATIDSKDMGVALAVAAQDEQISFIEAMVKEFNSWDNFDRDTQITHIIDEIQESEHKEEIVEFFKIVVDFYKYQTEEFTTVFLP